MKAGVAPASAQLLAQPDSEAPTGLDLTAQGNGLGWLCRGAGRTPAVLATVDDRALLPALPGGWRWRGMEGICLRSRQRCDGFAHLASTA
jgi:hypothetical protein